MPADPTGQRTGGPACGHLFPSEACADCREYRESLATAASRPLWRVGTKVPRNIYRDEKPVAVAVGADAEAEQVARAIVDAMNEREASS